MIYQLIVGIGLVLVFVNLMLNMYYIKSARRTSTWQGQQPMVSILVPARNEEDKIGHCLESLRNQQYDNFEILVLDDSSSDNTAGIVLQYSRMDERIRLINGKLLEEGWAGKPFACQQLAENARGEWLLFVDADTVHDPAMLGSTLNLARQDNISLMSGIPRQLGFSITQKIVIPVLYFIIVCWVPVWLLEIAKKKQKPSVAVGQFMLFERNFYCELGGHELVKNRIMEDVWFAVETTRKGGRYRFADLSEVVTCNMYSNLGEMWSGVLKWMYSVASISTWALIALMAVGYILFFAPFYALYNQLFVLPFHSAWFLIIIFQVSVVLLMRLVVLVRLREPFISPFFHPLGFAFVFTTCIYAAISWLRKDSVHWKERIYGGHSSIR